MATKFLHIGDIPAFVEDLIAGPSVTAPAETPYSLRAAEFTALVTHPILKPLYDHWLDLVAKSGGAPAYDRRSLLELAEVARSIVVGEFLPETRHMRARYMGQDLVERLGRDMTGRDVTEFNGLTHDETWRLHSPLVDEGRPLFIRYNYSHMNRGHVHIVGIDLPLSDAKSGQIRYCFGISAAIDPLAGKD